MLRISHSCEHCGPQGSGVSRPAPDLDRLSSIDDGLIDYDSHNYDASHQRRGHYSVVLMLLNLVEISSVVCRCVPRQVTCCGAQQRCCVGDPNERSPTATSCFSTASARSTPALS